MKKFITLMLTAATATAMSAAGTLHLTRMQAAPAASTSGIITEAPAGDAVECYGDVDNYSNVFGFMGDYHFRQNVVFSDNDKVYIPSPLNRTTMGAYLEGNLDKATGVITVEAGQLVYISPNEGINVCMGMLDKTGNVVNAATPEDFTSTNGQPLRFDLLEDGTIMLQSSLDYPYFGLYNADATNEVYAIGSDWQLTPTDKIDPLIKYYDLSFTDSSDRKRTGSASGYIDEETGIYWFKGLDPAYPEGWVKALKNGTELRVPSFQVVNYMMYDNPVVMAGTRHQENEITGEMEYVSYNYLPVRIEGDGFASAEDMLLANLVSYDEREVDMLTVYSEIALVPHSTVEAARPVNPTFVSYDPETGTDEREFTFLAAATDTDGNTLVTDHLYLRYYIDGKPYTFEPAIYSRLSAPLTLVPWNTDIYGLFMQNSDGTKRYTYFLKLPAETATMGVEIVYTLSGKEVASECLTYDIATGQVSYQDYSGVSSIATESRREVSTDVFDLQGRPAAADARGILIRLTRYSDGTTSTTKIVK